jgi:hypothetical protein
VREHVLILVKVDLNLAQEEMGFHFAARMSVNQLDFVYFSNVAFTKVKMKQVLVELIAIHVQFVFACQRLQGVRIAKLAIQNQLQVFHYRLFACVQFVCVTIC